MVKQVKSFGINTFFKNDTAECGAMAAAIEDCIKSPGNVVVWSWTKKDGKLWGHVTPDVFLHLMKLNRGLYEVIHAFPHKVYFDIDKKGKGDTEYLQTVKDIIEKYFPNADMAISGSIAEAKTSYHIVLQNYVIRNEADRQYMKHTVKHINATVVTPR